MLNQCHLGCVLEVLPALAATGVKAQTVVTSPPYWGLRDYGIAPSVWGGIVGCAHDWSAWAASHDVRESSVSGKTRTTERAYGEASRRFDGNHQKHSAGQHCSRCGAWRGNLGLESCHDCHAWARHEPPCNVCYVCHLRTVFALVWEVLADDGTCWINLGDSYSQSGRGGIGDKCTLDGSRRNQNQSRAELVARGKRPPGLKPKDRCGVPWRVALALQADGWYVRQDIIWHKPNPMPESVRDRCTSAHEYVFLLSKSPRYYYDAAAIYESSSPSTHARLAQNVAAQIGSTRANGGMKTNGNMKAVARKLAVPGNGIKNNGSFDAAMAVMPDTRNKRSVWTVASAPYAEAHFATFPPALIEPMILAGSRPGDLVLDPFFGSGTVGEVAQRLGRQWLGIDIAAHYAPLQVERTRQIGLALTP